MLRPHSLAPMRPFSPHAKGFPDLGAAATGAWSKEARGAFCAVGDEKADTPLDGKLFVSASKLSPWPPKPLSKFCHLVCCGSATAWGAAACRCLRKEGCCGGGTGWGAEYWRGGVEGGWGAALARLLPGAGAQEADERELCGEMEGVGGLNVGCGGWTCHGEKQSMLNSGELDL